MSWWAAVADGATADDGNTRRVEDGAVGTERSRLTRAGLADHHIDARTRRGERADHCLLIRVETRLGGEDLADEPAWDAGDAGVLPPGGAPDEFGFGDQQVDGRVAAFGLIDGADDAAGGVADAEQLAGGACGGCEDRDDAVVAQ